MPRYRARFVRREGRRCAMSFDAVDVASLTEQIETGQRGYIIEVAQKEARGGARLRVRGGLLLASLDSLELMLRAGVRVNVAVRSLAECSPRGAPSRLWSEVSRRIEEDGSFAGALRAFPRVFNASMVGVISAHEGAGSLADGIRHVRDYASQMQAIRRDASRALAYPALVAAAGFGVSMMLCLFTLPRFAVMLREIGTGPANPLTAFFLGLSACLVRRPWLVAAAPGAAAGLVLLLRRPRLRPAIDVLVLRLPLVGRAAEALSLARVCVTYRALAASGIGVLESLEACAAASGNAAIEAGIGRVIGSVRRNEPLGVGFERAGVFAPELVLAVKGGEGSLPEVFGRLAEHYAGEARHRVAMALGLVEPAMLVLILAWVFGIALAVVLPVVEVVNEIH
jgi:type II secretory pathway component PulF